MDPVSALGCASAVVQLVDFGAKLLGSSYDIYRSTNGAKEEHVHLNGICKHLHYLGRKIQTRSSAARGSLLKEDELYLLDLAEKGQEITARLLEVLGPLQVDTSRHFQTWEAFRVACKGLSNAGQIADLRQRMDELRGQITLHTIFMISNSQSAMAQSLPAITSKCEKMHAEQVNLITRSHASLVGMIRRQNQDFQLLLQSLQDVNRNNAQAQLRQNLAHTDLLLSDNVNLFEERDRQVATGGEKRLTGEAKKARDEQR